LKATPSAERQRRLYRNSVERHAQIASRESVAVDVTGHGGGSPERVIHSFPIDFLSVGCTDRGDGDYQSTDGTHLQISFFSGVFDSKRPASGRLHQEGREKLPG